MLLAISKSLTRCLSSQNLSFKCFYGSKWNNETYFYIKCLICRTILRKYINGFVNRAYIIDLNLCIILFYIYLSVMCMNFLSSNFHFLFESVGLSIY